MSAVPTDTVAIVRRSAHPPALGYSVNNVDVFRQVRSHGDVGELNRSLVVFISCCGITALALVGILHQLRETHSALPCEVDNNVFHLRGE
jgi:hypothetical protein